MSNQILTKVKMLEMGIVPAFTGDELKKMLESMSYKERRAAKRKFRKVWRNLARKDPTLAVMMTEGKGKNPDKSQKRNRSVLVVSELFMS